MNGERFPVVKLWDLCLVIVFVAGHEKDRIAKC